MVDGGKSGIGLELVGGETEAMRVESNCIFVEAVSLNSQVSKHLVIISATDKIKWKVDIVSGKV